MRLFAWKRQRAVARRRPGRAHALKMLPIEALETRQVMTGLLGLGVDPGADPDGNGLVVSERVALVGQADPGARVRLDIGGDGTFERMTRAGADGSFRFVVRPRVGTTSFAVQTRDADGALLRSTTSLTRSDAALAWNATLLDVVRRAGSTPPLAARNMGMVQVAMHDAFQAIARQRRPLAVSLPGRSGGSFVAAVNQAAYEVLRSLYPAQAAQLDATLREGLAAVPNGRAETAGQKVGSRVAQAILADRASDGSQLNVAYTPGTAAGDWVPTPAGFAPALLPQWPGVRPLALDSAVAYRPAGPPALASAQYAAEVNEVQQLGRATGSTRTADQTAIARFWADGANTFTPPGHWNQIARNAALEARTSLAFNLRMLALLDAALCDAAIVAWDAKYATNRWRPVTAIRQAANDGNDATTADASWSPLLATPPFPAYISGHSTFSAAAATVLDHYFGPDFAFDDTGAPGQNLGTRSFSGFQQAAEEAGLSRIYGGIHFQSDNVDGLAAGRAIGRAILSRFERVG